MHGRDLGLMLNPHPSGDIMSHKMRLSTFYSDIYEPRKLRSRRPNTKRLYRYSLKTFDQALGRPATIADLNDTTVTRFAAHRLDAGIQKSGVNRDLSNLLAIWRWAHTKHYVKNWPDVELEVLPTRVPVALLREEIELVYESINRETMPVDAIPGKKFWLALLLVIWDTGERIGAVMAIEWECVDLKTGWVRFPAEDRKGARDDNALPIAADTVAALSAIKPRGYSPSQKVFRWPYSSTYIYNRLARIMVRAGLPNNRLYKFHVLRKSVASHYEAAGGNATELLKHSSRKITRTYLDPRIVQPVSAKDLLFRPGA